MREADLKGTSWLCRLRSARKRAIESSLHCSAVVFGAFEIDMDMVAVGVVKVDLDYGKARYRIDRIYYATVI